MTKYAFKREDICALGVRARLMRCLLCAYKTYDNMKIKCNDNHFVFSCLM